MFRFLICDSDDVFCQKQKQLIREYYAKQGIKAQSDIFHTGEEIIPLGEKLASYNAIFLDVGMETVSGIDLANWLNGAAPNLAIVFVSDHMNYALDGYKVGAVRYIMKGEEQFRDSMEECLKFILRRFQKGDIKYITITEEKLRVSVDKVLYVESKAHKITYHLMKNSDTGQEYTVYGKLDDVQKELGGFDFCRVHQSFLVNMNYVRDVMRYRVILLDGTQIQISKNNYKTAADEFVRVRGTF